MSNILIIGYGVVGHNLAKEIEILKPDIVDKYKDGVTTKRDIKYDIAFVCVDTPYVNPAITCDTSEVENTLNENDAEIYVFKSTCPVGMVELMKEKTGKRIIFSPEYYGGTQHCNNYNFDFTILGGDKDTCNEVIQVLQRVYDGRHTFRITDSRTAELVKYMENTWLATKVSFCNQFADIASQLKVDYEQLRELFILDPRVNPSHTFVYKDAPYWNSHCLNKDVPAIASQCYAPFVDAVIEYNNCKKEEYLQ